MTDRELLELAAKAAGLNVEFGTLEDSGEVREGAWLADSFDEWDPLTDDGDALRLAVKLHLIVQCNPNSANAGMWFPLNHINELHDDDPYAATRRAIVRAAAEIGRKHD